MVKEKQVYFFTFGMGQPKAGHCQPILASSRNSARELMHDLHGNRYAFCYTEMEYLRNRIKGTSNEVILETIEGR